MLGIYIYLLTLVDYNIIKIIKIMLIIWIDNLHKRACGTAHTNWMWPDSKIYKLYKNKIDIMYKNHGLRNYRLATADKNIVFKYLVKLIYLTVIN